MKFVTAIKFGMLRDFLQSYYNVCDPVVGSNFIFSAFMRLYNKAVHNLNIRKYYIRIKNELSQKSNLKSRYPHFLLFEAIRNM
jgi:hypothetical protein